MANIKSAKKRVTQTLVRTARNKSRMSRVRTFLKAVDQEILAGNVEKAQAACREAESELMRAVSKGILQIKTVSRKVSRLSARIKSLPR
ncbi:MAG: 30S ribosomal protein S20 [Alphaproteobacteria bacterium]|jgi:small subunit ribosomal protein S20|nr:30S ribosomal protein S20 [Alphaproteobacteria bacterium]